MQLRRIDCAGQAVLIAALLILAAWQWPVAAVWQGHALQGKDVATVPSDVTGYVALLASMSWISLSYRASTPPCMSLANHVTRDVRCRKPCCGQHCWSWQSTWRSTRSSCWPLNQWQSPRRPLRSLFWQQPTLAARKANSCCDSLLFLAVLSSVFSMLMRARAFMRRWPAMELCQDSRFHQRCASRGHHSARRLEYRGRVVQYLGTIDQLLRHDAVACSALAVASIWRITRLNLWMVLTKRKRQLPGGSIWLPSFHILGPIAMLAGVLADGQKRDQFWAMCITFAIGAVIYSVWKMSSSKRSIR